MLLSNVFAGTSAAAAGRPYLDFGARLYDPRTAAWLSQDPMAEKYYPVSPYAYCAGNPVNLVDPDGMWFTDSSLSIEQTLMDDIITRITFYDIHNNKTIKNITWDYLLSLFQ